ncbi:MAG TPA: saccharopine dehydrogenase NADP-binding domain-containing protein [Longimicrobiales bacterium]|nr:saccharopine dehydrogenase NADP-binding domain-containing protein [Longimicrobiales bacterium]
MAVLLYGANGYSGRLIAGLSGDYGIRPILAGRDADAVAAMGRELGLEHRIFPLDDGAALAAGISGVAAVLHCAGPFSRTARPMASACVRAGVHYIDITGEIDVFESLAARSREASDAGVMLLPGAGFDVVPSDCLAAHLAGRLPGARRLVLAIRGSGPLSRGTATTAMENQHRGGMVRRGGALTAVPPAWRTRLVDFGDGRPVTTVTIPWGDVATAYHSTGIGDIEVYAAVPPALVRFIRLTRWLGPLPGLKPVQALQRRLIRARAPGPGPDELATGSSAVWGRVEDDAGGSAAAVVHGPNGYLLTAHATLVILRRVLGGDAPPGFRTPSGAYGHGLLEDIPGVSLRDLPEA